MKQSTIGWGRRLLVMLVMGVMAALAVSAQKSQVGYWTLAYKKVFQEDEKEWGGVKPTFYKAHIINAREGLAEFQIEHSKPAREVYDGNLITNENTVSVSWSAPEMYVKIGEEDKITIDFEAAVDGKTYNPSILNEYNVPKLPDPKKNNVVKAVNSQTEYYDIEFAVTVMPEVTVNNKTIGFSYFQQQLNESTSLNDVNGGLGDAYEDAIQKACSSNDGELPNWEDYIKDEASGKIAYDDDKWSYYLKLGQESYLLVTLSITYHCEVAMVGSRQGGKTNSVQMVYLYRYGGEDVEVVTRTDDTTAWGDDGESSGTPLPPWVIPVAVVTVCTPIGYTLLRNRRKNGQDGNPNGASTGGPYGTYQPPVTPGYNATVPPVPPGTPVPPVPPGASVPPAPPVPPGATPPVPPDPLVPPAEPPVPPVKPPVPPAEPSSQPTEPQQDSKQDDSEEEEEGSSTYRMILYKEFGDTLMVGDEPQMVGARIEEVTAKGKKKRRDDLTAQIEIVEGENITIVEKGMAEEYRAALVKVEDAPEKEPWEGDITFVFNAPGGSLRNKVVFKIEDGEIRFFQENLTLPARYEKEVKLPFIVLGMNDGTAKIKAKIVEDGHDEPSEDYRVRTEWNEKEQRYYAIIKDLLTEERADKGIPGNYIGFYLKLEAEKDEPVKRVIEGVFPIYRYYMGLVMRMDGNVKCYLEEFDPSKHDPKYKTTQPDGKEFVPAEQECYLKLYDYDEEKNQLLVIDPNPLDVKWTVKDLKDQGGAQKVIRDLIGNEMSEMGMNAALAAAGLGSIGTLVSAAHSQVFSNVEKERILTLQKQVVDLGLSFEAKWIEDTDEADGQIYYVLRSVAGALRSPNRFDVEMEVTAEYKKKTYSYKRMVHLLSQPVREFTDPESKAEALKADEKIRHGLEEILGAINVLGLNEDWGPLVHFISLQLDYYDATYGFDKGNIKAIQKTYMNGLERLREEAHAVSDEATRIDKLEWYNFEWWIQRSLEGHDYLEKQHWLVRVGWAILSLGYTELVFNIPYKMKQYVDSEENATVGGGFVVGVKEAAWHYGTEVAFSFAIGSAGVVVKTVGKGASAAGRGVVNVVRGVIKTGSKEALKAGGKATGQVIKSVTKESLKTGVKMGKDAMAEAFKVMGQTMKSEVITRLNSWAKKQIGSTAHKYLEGKVKAFFSGTKGAASSSKYVAAEAGALEQAVKNVEDLKTMADMVDWNATPENVRLMNQLIFVCQADKQTMMLLKTPRLLGGNPRLVGESLKNVKKYFNNLLRKVYDETDDLVIKDLAKAGKIPVNKVQVYKGATGSKGDLLKEGLDITFDRDVTYYYIGVDKKMHYFSQRYVEALYAKHFRNVVNSRTLSPNKLSFNPASVSKETAKKIEMMEAKKAAIVARVYDQTVIEDVLHHEESYGVDLDRMIKKELHGEALRNPAKVADAVFHKGAERFDRADRLWSMARMTEGRIKKELLERRAVSEMMEGCRQLQKTFDLISSRDAKRHIISKISTRLRDAIDLLRKLNGVENKLSEVEAGLEKMGYSFLSLADDVSETCIKVG